METNIDNYLRIKASLLEAKKVLYPSVAIDNELKAIYKVINKPVNAFTEILYEVATELSIEVRV